MKIKRYLFYLGAIQCFWSCKTVSIPNNKPLDNIVLVGGDTLYGKVDYFKEKFASSEFYRKIRLTDTNGRKRKFKRKNVLSYRVDGSHYESFMLKKDTQYFKNGSVLETRYLMDANGVQHFLKVGTKGNLSYYELEWIDQDNNDIMSMDLVKKTEGSTFIRASYGVFQVARKVLSDYLSDCPEIQKKIMQKDFKYVFQVVDFYNENCVKE